MGSRRVGHDWATSLSLFTFMHWRRKWQPTPVFLPGESQGGSRTESDTTEVTQQQQVSSKTSIFQALGSIPCQIQNLIPYSQLNLLFNLVRIYYSKKIFMGMINILKHLEIQGNFKALFFLGWLCLGLLSAWSCCAFTSKHLLEQCFLTFSWECLYDILGYAEGNLGEFAIKMVKTAIAFPIYYIVMRTINITMK